MVKEFGININRNIQSRIYSSGKLRDIATLLEREREIYVVYDENVSHIAAEVVDSVAGQDQAGVSSIKGCFAIDTSEELKTMDTVLLICRQLMEADASRKALVLAIGGGITTDLTGFAASIYKRGVRYANIPTTLLAQVDAAIGGKTGVNFDGYKNMLGVIVQPQFTFLCPEVLRTLPVRELRAGIAEMLKTFLIADADAYSQAVSFFTAGKSPEIPSADLILKAAAIKAAIVERDPYESGERAKLNLGHTFAHAIEHEARKRGDDIVHGEAVAIGIIMAAEKAEREGFAENGLTERLRRDFKALNLPTECPYTALDYTKDKKSAGGSVTFILPVRPGEVIMKSYDLHHNTE